MAILVLHHPSNAYRWTSGSFDASHGHSLEARATRYIRIVDSLHLLTFVAEKSRCCWLHYIPAFVSTTL